MDRDVLLAEGLHLVEAILEFSELKNQVLSGLPLEEQAEDPIMRIQVQIELVILKTGQECDAPSDMVTMPLLKVLAIVPTVDVVEVYLHLQGKE